MFVRTRVKWPHEFVLSDSSKERTSYDQLTMPQWMAGFCRTMREETNQNLKDHMLNYLIDLMDDANDFSWGAAKASHVVLLCRMEQGEVTGYDQVDRIDRIRRANAQKHVVQGFPSSSSAQYNKKTSLKVGKTMLANFITKIHVLILVHMKPKVYCINTYVPTASHQQIGHFHIRKWTVETRKKCFQKMKKPGHEPFWCSCP